VSVRVFNSNKCAHLAFVFHISYYSAQQQQQQQQQNFHANIFGPTRSLSPLGLDEFTLQPFALLCFALGFANFEVNH